MEYLLDPPNIVKLEKNVCQPLVNPFTKANNTFWSNLRAENFPRYPSSFEESFDGILKGTIIIWIPEHRGI